jgi:GT2 family glycosyltransferase
MPLFNCVALTRACIASLQETLPAGIDHEIILVDDGSTDGTRDWLRTLREPFRVLLNDKNLGYAAANNRGIALARGEFLALLNNDLVLGPRWLEPMLAAHAALGPRAGVVGNVQLNAATGAVDHAGIDINRQGKPEHARSLPPRWSRRLRRTRVVPAVTGACLLVTRALWDRLGGFDEGFHNGGEDVDLCFRARAGGRVTVVALDSVIRHHVSSSPGRKLRDEENSYRLARRWRREFLADAADATRGWCRDYLRAALIAPKADEYALALRALMHASRLATRPPAAAALALESALAREFARWHAMFGA